MRFHVYACGSVCCQSFFFLERRKVLCAFELGKVMYVIVALLHVLFWVLLEELGTYMLN